MPRSPRRFTAVARCWWIGAPIRPSKSGPVSYTHLDVYKRQVLCGVRDVRDYRIHSSREKAVITGGSAFNIKAKSLRLGDFTREETELLYGRHTEETGQIFTPEALDRLWDLSRGQPWLVNALGYEVCFEMKAGRDRQRSDVYKRHEGNLSQPNAVGNAGLCLQSAAALVPESQGCLLYTSRCV